jgi:hypothetical protein
VAAHVPAQFSPRVHAGSVFWHICDEGQGAILKPHGRPVSWYDCGSGSANVVTVNVEKRRRRDVVRRILVHDLFFEII